MILEIVGNAHIVLCFRSLILKDFGLRYLSPLLKNIKAMGIYLKRLDLHFLDSSPGISIEDIDSLCPHLEHLTICDSLLTWTEDGSTPNFPFNKKLPSTQHFCRKHTHVPCSKRDHFQNLKVCKLYRVEYRQSEDWEIFLRFSSNLTSLHITSSRYMTDSSFQSILLDNNLTNLEV